MNLRSSPDSVFEAVIPDSLKASLARYRPEDRQEIERLVRLIELNPWIDGEHKASVSVGSVVYSAYNNGRWHIVYRLVDSRFVEIHGISRITR